MHNVSLERGRSLITWTSWSSDTGRRGIVDMCVRASMPLTSASEKIWFNAGEFGNWNPEADTPWHRATDTSVDESERSVSALGPTADCFETVAWSGRANLDKLC